jgi:hypothetical protein
VGSHGEASDHTWKHARVPGCNVASSGSLAWLKNTTVDPKNQVYRDLSLSLQAILKRHLRDSYFRDVNQYKDLATAYLVLLYAAIPPSNSIVVDGNVSSVLSGIYWDTADINAVRGMANAARDSASAQGFKAQIAQAQARLLEAGKTDPDLTRVAGFYDPRDASVGIFNTAVAGANMGLLKDSLLFVERNVISGARDAALDAASFNSLSGANQPDKALQALADFGNKLTEAFNKDLSSVFVQDNDALQRLSPLIFAQASTVFDPSIPITNYDSTLNVTVLKASAAMPANFPDSHQRITTSWFRLTRLALGFDALSASLKTEVGVCMPIRRRD